MTYYSVLSTYSVCLAFLIAELNGLDIMVCGVGDLYLNSTFGVDVLFAAGPDRGPEKTGKVMVMVRDLYGLKSSGVSWRTMFA